MNEQIVYKIVTSDLKSMNAFCEETRLQYSIDNTITPEFGLIFCFDTLWNAKQFVMREQLLIFECMAYDTIPLERMCWFASPKNIFINFWNNKMTKNDFPDEIMTTWKGTLGCKAIKLLKQVYSS